MEASESAFYVREHEFATTFTDRWHALAPDVGFAAPSEAVGPGQFAETDAAELAARVYRQLQEHEWADDGDLYVLADPVLLDRETRDPFRRTLRVVFERLPPEVHYPYNMLEEDADRVKWLTASIDTGEVLPPSRSWKSGDAGVNRDQRSLDSF